MPTAASIPLDPDKIKADLPTRIVGKKVIVYDSTASANDIAAEYARGTDNNGLVVFAEHQTAGRGRRANKWISRPGQSILCSVLLSSPACTAEILTLSTAVAVAETIGLCGAKQAKIKWPNDIIINGKKLAGILLESAHTARTENFILGIGINCHQSRQCFPAQLRKIATSIDIERGGICDRLSLARRLLVSLDKWLQRACNDPDRTIQRWRQLSTQLGHRITVQYDQRQFTGNCIGIDPAKGMILQLDANIVRMFDAAHTTIVK